MRGHVDAVEKHHGAAMERLYKRPITDAQGPQGPSRLSAPRPIGHIGYAYGYAYARRKLRALWCDAVIGQGVEGTVVYLHLLNILGPQHGA